MAGRRPGPPRRDAIPLTSPKPLATTLLRLCSSPLFLDPDGDTSRYARSELSLSSFAGRKGTAPNSPISTTSGDSPEAGCLTT